MLKGQKIGESKYPMRLICKKCGEYYTIHKHRRSNLCFVCASTVSQDFFDKKGKHFERWFKGMKRYIEETEELLKQRSEE